MINELEEQVGRSDQGTWSGKTCRERSVQTKEPTSRRSSRKSSKSANRKLPTCLCLRGGRGAIADASTMNWGDGALLGDFTMRSFGESPREENESRLSQILEDSAHPKYYLSARACSGILARAARRGKELPEVLKAALENQIERFGD